MENGKREFLEALERNVMPTTPESEMASALSRLNSDSQTQTIANLYVIRDNVMGEDELLLPAPNDVAALRFFEDRCFTEPISNHPEDYTFHRVGRWNRTRTYISPEDEVRLACAKDYHDEDKRTS
jgi:hypothetical protein